jgi:hypothetical protein
VDRPARVAYAVRVVANVPEPADQRQMRVSNADRDRVAALLQQASADGRLDLDELDQRLKEAYAARTYADLEPLTRDLPAAVEQADESAVAPRPTSQRAFALMGGFARRGAWVVPQRFSAFVLCGGGTIDMRQARFAGNDVTIRIFAVMGGVEVIVPPAAHVTVDGVAVMGGWDQPAEDASTPGGPRITVTGFALMGGVDVKRRPRSQHRHPS